MGIYSQGKKLLNEKPVVKAAELSEAKPPTETGTFLEQAAKARDAVADVQMPVQPLNLNVVDVGKLAEAVKTMQQCLQDTITGSTVARKATDTAFSQQVQFIAVMADVQAFLAELREGEALKRRVLEKLDRELG